MSKDFAQEPWELDALDEESFRSRWAEPPQLFDATAFDGDISETDWANLEEGSGPAYGPWSTDLDPFEIMQLINVVRSLRGLRPLSVISFAGAVPGDMQRCLLARAMDCDIDGTSMWFHTTTEADAVREALKEVGEEELVQLPEPLRRSRAVLTPAN